LFVDLEANLIKATSAEELDLLRKDFLRSGARIGFVPTMGALHAGHLSLIDLIAPKVDKVVVSIFVNPKQFGPKEDLNRYPRPLEQDLKLLASKNVAAVFLPRVEDLYPENFSTYVVNKRFSHVLCGATRQNHFEGVLTVVMKLFMMVRPQIAAFGKKDYQQLQLIKAMVRDFSLGIEIDEGEVVREESGLAMSSRNQYLAKEQKRVAATLYRSLQAARSESLKTRNKDNVVKAGKQVLASESELALEYFEVRRRDLEEFETEIDKPAVAMLAARLGDVRLIDCLEL
jgi:pantoate--beta-alanine ligase